MNRSLQIAPPGFGLRLGLSLQSTLGTGLLVLLCSGLAAPAAGQDVLSLGNVGADAGGQTIVVPVYLRDRPGTVLGGDANPGREIHQLAVTVLYSPIAAVTALNFARAGVTKALTPRFEAQIAAPARRSWVASFDPPVPLTLGNALPGNLIGELAVGVVAGATNVDLELLVDTTALGDLHGATIETSANGELELRDGSILIPHSIFSDGFESGDTTAWTNTKP